MAKGTKMRMSLLAVLVIALVLAFGGTALAQDSATQDAYGGVLGNEVESSASTTAAVSGAENGSLPFTGFEAGIVALAGIGLVGLGFAMRRSTRRNDA
jgi:predicted cobalt transporter CbtA